MKIVYLLKLKKYLMKNYTLVLLISAFGAVVSCGGSTDKTETTNSTEKAPVEEKVLVADEVEILESVTTLLGTSSSIKYDGIVTTTEAVLTLLDYTTHVKQEPSDFQLGGEPEFEYQLVRLNVDVENIGEHYLAIVGRWRLHLNEQDTVGLEVFRKFSSEYSNSNPSIIVYGGQNVDAGEATNSLVYFKINNDQDLSSSVLKYSIEDKDDNVVVCELPLKVSDEE